MQASKRLTGDAGDYGCVSSVLVRTHIRSLLESGSPYATVDELGTDAFRYFLLREVPFGHDGDFSRDAFIGRINSDLANGLGNLLSRTLTLIERSSNGLVPEPVVSAETERERELQQAAHDLLHTALPRHQQSMEFNRALEAIWGLVQLGNQYIDKTAPWTLAKATEDRPRLNTVLYHAAETLRHLCMAIAPFMPQTADGLARQLGLSVDCSKPLLAAGLQWGGLEPGTSIAKGTALFPRVEASALSQGGTRVTATDPTASPSPDESARSSAHPTSTTPPATPPDGRISIEDFQKIQLRTAKVLSAERVPKSNKLIKLQVDIGTEHRQIVAGIGKRYEPDALVGRTVVIVANLKPAKLMGVESQGMVLAAGDQEVAGLVTFSEDVEAGTKVK